VQIRCDMRLQGSVLTGVTAGFIAAGVMSAARLIAHRAGLIDRMVPQVLQERVAGTARVDVPGDTPAHQLAAEVIHHAVGMATGGLLGGVTTRPSLAAGVGYGLLIWIVDVVGLLPALRVERVGGRAVDAVAHGIFGATLAFAMRELAGQRRMDPKPAAIPLRRRVG
jgi:hypothetical protein